MNETMKQRFKNSISKTLFIGLTATALFAIMPSCVHRHSHRESSSSNCTTETASRRRNASHRFGKTTVKMRFSNGVYYVPCMINGTNMEFIFDTGASDIVISLTEALFLMKQGKLSTDEILDSVYFQVADGSIKVGSVIVLETVTIGDRTLRNVRATIVPNMSAPLLLGQSALSRFGKLSINYRTNEITFE